MRSEQFMEWTYNVNWIFIIRAHNKLNDTYVLHTLKLGFVITGVVKFSQYVFLVTLLGNKYISGQFKSKEQLTL